MKRSWKSLVRTGAVLAAVAAILPGCSFSFSAGEDLNTDRAEEVIAEGILDQTGAEVTVACPDDVAIEQDDTFECTAEESDGTESTVEVTQTDDEGNIRWELR